MPSKKNRVSKTRRERRKSKQSGFTRPIKKAGMVGHGGSGDQRLRLEIDVSTKEIRKPKPQEPLRGLAIFSFLTEAGD